MVAVRVMDNIIPSLFGALASAFMGIVIYQNRAVIAHLSKLNGRLADHLENKDLHYAAAARTDEQIKSLTNMVSIAHERIDALKEA